jgi:phospholipase C
MPPDQLKHIVVLMMENRSFDHMLGYLQAQDPRIDGVTGAETNPDTTGALASVEPLAQYQSQLQPDPGHHFEDVKLQIYGDPLGGPTMQGFIKAYFQKRRDVNHSREIMYCFRPDKVPVLATLAREYCVFNRWFSSLPGPTIPNRAFAHFGTSFGKVDMDLFYLGVKYPTIYQRMLNQSPKQTAKIYYFDQSLGMAFILQNQPEIFGTFSQFQADCQSGDLPAYSFIEPNYADHTDNNGAMLASDQHPDHNVLAGEEFIASVYNSIRNNEELWKSTMLLIVYDEHGGLYDHVEPPVCTPDEFQDPATGFKFDRLGIRVPAVLVSPWIPAGTVIGTADDNFRKFDHASIPATVTKRFIGDFADRSPRELSADTFLDILSLPVAREDYTGFDTGQRARGFMASGQNPGTTVSHDAAPINSLQPERKLSELLQNEVQSYYKVEKHLPADQRTNIDIAKIQTEGAASAYIQQVIAKLRQ